jgi:hypothetical protein
MMIAQVDRHKVTDHVIPAGAAVASRLLFSVSAKTGSTDPHDEGQHRPISGSTARCAGLRSPDGEVLQRTADRSANTGAPGSIWAIPDQGSLVIAKTGTYTYRFNFEAEGLSANGAPCAWTAGPTIEGSTAVTVTPTAAGGAQLSFILAGSANGSATVLNLAGRPVRTLVADKPFDAGTQTLLWDRRSDTGLAVPSGLYLLHLTARTADGNQSSAVAAVTLR